MSAAENLTRQKQANVRIMGSTSAHLLLLLVGVHLLHLPLVLVLLHMPLGIGVRLQTTTLSGENVNVDVRDDGSDDVADDCVVDADGADYAYEVGKSVKIA